MSWSITMFNTEHMGSGLLGVKVEEPWDAGSLSSAADVAAAAAGGVKRGDVGVIVVVPRQSHRNHHAVLPFLPDARFFLLWRATIRREWKSEQEGRRPSKGGHQERSFGSKRSKSL
jgi:hypothetical protein